MDLFEWGPKYQLGIKSIDNQHKVLIELINKIHKMVMTFEEGDYRIILEELIDYSKMHFEYEEQLFLKFQYKDKEKHSEAHRIFGEEISKRMADLEGTQFSRDIQLSTLLLFLKNWLEKHILEEDKKYVSVYKKWEKST